MYLKTPGKTKTHLPKHGLALKLEQVEMSWVWPQKKWTYFQALEFAKTRTMVGRFGTSNPEFFGHRTWGLCALRRTKHNPYRADGPLIFS